MTSPFPRRQPIKQPEARVRWMGIRIGRSEDDIPAVAAQPAVLDPASSEVITPAVLASSAYTRVSQNVFIDWLEHDADGEQVGPKRTQEDANPPSSVQQAINTLKAHYHGALLASLSS